MTTLPPSVEANAGVAPPAGGAPIEQALTLTTDRSCVRCSYNLLGLPLAGKCPECGTPVTDSLKGILLQFASPEYLKTLHSGLSLILNGILLMIVVWVADVLLGIRGGGGQSARLLASGLGLIPSIMLILGYWRYTQPDPGFVGKELPNAARKVMRVTVLIQAAATATMFVLQLVLEATGTSAGGAVSIFALIVLVVTVAGVGAWVVQFFATMRYTRWMASRVPDVHIVKRTRTYMWLLPVIAAAGSVVLVGPLIALVMYWNLLDRLRKQVKAIRSTGVPAALKGALG